MPPVRLLAISGSLRAASLNSALLRAVAGLAPADVCVELFTGLSKLPLFNPDLEITDSPAVADFYAHVLEADGVIIASPEYAHGVTGAMKNALDWMVGSQAFVNKPVALLNASPRATIAQASLKETLTVMSLNQPRSPCLLSAPTLMNQELLCILPFQHQFERCQETSIRRL